MKILLCYASTEGQTRKIVRYAADWLTNAEHSTELLHADDTDDLDLTGFDGVLVAASVHVGRYQREIETFAARYKAELAKKPTLFLSVSLAAAGDSAEDHAELGRIVARMTDKTGWTPSRVEQVAGAFRFTEYDFFRTWAMRWIASQKDQDVDTKTDTEYTDWKALAEVLSDWSAGLSKGKKTP